MNAYPNKYQTQFIANRKTFSERNSQYMSQLKQQKNQIQIDKQFQLGNNSSYYSGDVEIEEVTEEFLFENSEPVLDTTQKTKIIKQSNAMDVSKQIYFQDGEYISNKIKKYSYNEKDFQLNTQQYFNSYKNSQQYNQDYSHTNQDYSMKNIDKNNHTNYQNEFISNVSLIPITSVAERMKFIFPSEILIDENKQKIKFFKQKIVEAKQSHEQLLKWIQKQKELFWKYLMQSIQYMVQNIFKLSLSNTLNLKNNDQQINLLKRQLQQKIFDIKKLQQQNEGLHEQIFDIGQQIQGIDIIVEEKVRQKVKELQLKNSRVNQKNKNHNFSSLESIIESDNHLKQLSNSNNYKTQQIVLNKMKQENQQLKEKLADLQIVNKSSQFYLLQFQKIIKFRELQVQKNEQEMKKQWEQIQQFQDQLFKSEQNLKINEQILMKQIQSIRQKENELIKWQAELYEKETQVNQKQKMITRERQQINDKQRLINEKQTLMRQKQRQNKQANNYNLCGYKQNNNTEVNRHNSKLLIKHQHNSEQYTVDNNYKMSFNPKQYVKQNGNYKKYQNSQNQPQQLEQYYSNLENGNSLRRIVSPNQIKQPNIRMGNYRQTQKYEQIKRQNNRKQKQSEREIQRISNFSSNSQSFRSTNPTTHQFVLPSNLNRAHSPNRSQSRSRDKSLIIHHKPNSVNSWMGRNFSQISQPKCNFNLNGLGSKLQKLRQQIKKQINAIK